MSDLLDDMFGATEEDEDFDWKEHYIGMPEYSNSNIKPYKSLIVHFKNEEDYKKFSELIQQKLTPKTKSTYFPVPNKSDASKFRYVDES